MSAFRESLAQTVSATPTTETIRSYLLQAVVCTRKYSPLSRRPGNSKMQNGKKLYYPSLRNGVTLYRTISEPMNPNNSLANQECT